MMAKGERGRPDHATAVWLELAVRLRLRLRRARGAGRRRTERAGRRREGLEGAQNWRMTAWHDMVYGLI